MPELDTGGEVAGLIGAGAADVAPRPMLSLLDPDAAPGATRNSQLPAWSHDRGARDQVRVAGAMLGIGRRM
jgi:hypothetical protein